MLPILRGLLALLVISAGAAGASSAARLPPPPICGLALTLEDESLDMQEVARRAMTPSHAAYTLSRNQLAAYVLRRALRIASRRILDPNDRADVAQESALAVIEGLARYDVTQPFDGWITTIIVRRIADASRSRNRHERLGLRATGGNDESILDRAPTPAAAAEPFPEDGPFPLMGLIAFLEAQLNAIEDPARLQGEDESARQIRLQHAQVMRGYLAGASSQDLARRFALTEQTVNNWTFRYRTRWLAQAEADDVIAPGARANFGSQLHGLLANLAIIEERRAGAVVNERLRAAYLGDAAELAPLDVWEEIHALPNDEQLALRQIIAGKTADPEALQRGHERLQENLRVRLSLYRRFLTSEPDRTFADLQRALEELPELQRQVVHQVALGKSYADAARTVGLADGEQVRLQLHYAAEGVSTRFHRPVHDVAAWIQQFALERAPGKTHEDFWEALERLDSPEQREVVRRRAAGRTNLEIAASMGQPVEQVARWLEDGRRGLQTRLMPGLSQGQRWLGQYLLEAHPTMTEAKFWELAEKQLDDQRLAVVRRRYAGESAADIATALRMRGVRKVKGALETARESIEKVWVDANKGTNPYPAGTADAWVWDWVLYRHNHVSAAQFWRDAPGKLNAKEMAAVRLRANGRSGAEILAATQIVDAARLKIVLLKARKKINTLYAPKPRQRGGWMAKILARNPERHELDFHAAVAKLGADHQLLVKLKLEDKSPAAIAAALKLVGGARAATMLTNYVGRKLDLMLRPLPAGGKKWIDEFVLDRFPNRTLEDFQLAVAALPDEQRKMIEHRVAGKTIEAASEAMQITPEDGVRSLAAARDRLMRSLKAKKKLP